MAFGTLKVNRIEGSTGLVLDLSGTTKITFDTNLEPDAGNTRNIGANLARWKDIYVNNVHTDDVYILPAGATARISSGGQARLAIEGNTNNAALASIIQNGSVSILELGRGGDNAIGSVVAVSDQQDLGIFRFAGTDGTNLVGAAGLIATAEANWTTSARPASLSFATRAANESGSKTKLSISPTGSTYIGNPSEATVGGNTKGEHVNLHVSRAISTRGGGGTVGCGILSDGEIQADLSTGTLAAMYLANPRTVASTTPYTIPNLTLYDAQQSAALGNGCTITNAYAFRAADTLSKANRSIGFRSEVSAAVANNRGFNSTASSAANEFNSETYVSTLATKRTYTGGVSADATLTTGLIFGAGYASGTPSIDITLTLPTGTACDAHFQQLPDDYGSEWTVINLSAGNTITVEDAATGHTAAGDLVVAAGTSGRFLTYKTAENTFQTARIA